MVRELKAAYGRTNQHHGTYLRGIGKDKVNGNPSTPRTTDQDGSFETEGLKQALQRFYV
jgi:hypothetical protein